jgi:hypothetical protein
MQRDPIYAALLAQLTALTVAPYQVAVVSRGFVMWDQADIQPAIYIAPGTETGDYKMGMPTKWIIKLELYVYVKWVDDISQGVTLLAQIMDGIDYVLSPVGPNGVKVGNQFVNTLGGLAQYCALSGPAEISGGFLNRSQSVARMPVEIMVA